MGFGAKLLRARRDQTYVRLVRSPEHADDIDGFIVAVGEEWAVIQATREGGYFDGYSAFRLKDVKKLRTRLSDFSAEFARTLPTWPPRCPEGTELDSTMSVVRSMAAGSRLLGIEQERRLSAIWIGQLDEVERKWVWLLEVRPDATWHDVPLGYKTRNVTLVSVDSMYQRALTVVAGPSPKDREMSG